MNRIDSILDDIQALLQDPAVDSPVKRYVNSELADLRPQIDKVTDGDRKEDFLLRELQAARERYQIHCSENTEQRLADSPYDTTREQPVCTCGGKHAHRCPLKRGELPREVREADDITTGIREFRASHNGNPLVLESAQEDWAKAVAGVESTLQEFLIVLSANSLPQGVTPEDTMVQL